MAADLDVVRDAQLGKQRQILEGAADAQSRDAVGGPAEQAAPMQ